MRDADHLASQRAVEFRFGQVGQLHIGRTGTVEHSVDNEIDSVVAYLVGQPFYLGCLGDVAGNHPDVPCAGSDDGPQPLGDGAGLPRPVDQRDPPRALLGGIFAELQTDVACTTSDQHMPARQRRRVRRRTGVGQAFRVQTAVA